MRNLYEKIRPRTLKEKLWQYLAKFIASHPAIVDWIIANAKTKPYSDINDYMERYWFTPRWMLGLDENGKLFPKWWVPYIFKVRAHLIKRPDKGLVKHDHPCDNRSIVMRNWYDEEDIFGRSNIRSAGDTVFRRAEVFHRIAATPAQGVWSLWWMAEKVNRWGYLVDGRKVYYKNYEANQ